MPCFLNSYEIKGLRPKASNTKTHGKGSKNYGNIVQQDGFY